MSQESQVLLSDARGKPLLWRGTKNGDGAVYKRLPDYLTLVNEGRVWKVQDPTTTAVLVAVPTTVSGLTIQNPTRDKFYVVYALSAFVDVVPGTLGMVSSWICAHKFAVATLFTRDITLQATGAGAVNGPKAGQGAYRGEIILDRGATVVDDGWSPTPLQIESNIVTTNFVAKEAPLIVPVVIPPGYHASIAGMATVVTFEAGWGLTWSELDREEIEE